MIIVLQDADFSARNIGKVEFSAELTAETKAVMNYATRFPQDKYNEYAQALNSLISGLVTSGIYDKISTLVIPIMSSNIEECSKNQKTGAANPNATYFAQLFGQRPDYTLERKAYEYTDTNTHCGYTIAHDSGNFSLFGCYLNNVGSEYTYPTDIIGANKNGWYGLSNGITYIAAGPTGRVYSGGAIALDANNKSLLANQPPITTPFVASFDGLNVSCLNKIGFVSGSIGSSPQDTNLIRLYPLICGARNSQSQGSLSIFGCGEKLAAAEMRTMYELLGTFAQAFA